MFANLNIFQTMQAKIEPMGVYTTLAIFLIPLAIAEIMGLYSGALILTGSVITGIIIYIIKIPVAGLTFWVFSFSKDKLLTLDWFETLFNLLIRFFDFIKATKIYRRVRYQIYKTKKYFRSLKGGTFKEDVNRVYTGLKDIFKVRAT